MKLNTLKTLIIIGSGVLLVGCSKSDHQAIDDTVKQPQTEGEYQQVGDDFFTQNDELVTEESSEVEQSINSDGVDIVSSVDNYNIEIFETEGNQIVYELIEPLEDDSRAIYGVLVTDYDGQITGTQFNYITPTYMLETDHAATVQQRKNQGVDIVSLYQELSAYLPQVGNLNTVHIDLAHVYQVSPTDYENYVYAMSELLNARGQTTIITGEDDLEEVEDIEFDDAQ